jgi:hypothetical protein
MRRWAAMALAGAVLAGGPSRHLTAGQYGPSIEADSHEVAGPAAVTDIAFDRHRC